jgi:hypothetical protein
MGDLEFEWDDAKPGSATPRDSRQMGRARREANPGKGRSIPPLG